MQIKIGVCPWQLIAEKVHFLLWRCMVIYVNMPMGQSSRSRDQPESYSIRIHFTISCMLVFFYLSLPFQRMVDTMCLAFPCSHGVLQVLPYINMSMIFALVYPLTWHEITTTALKTNKQTNKHHAFLMYLVPFLYFQLDCIDFYLMWASVLWIWHLKLGLVLNQHTIICLKLL